MWLTSDKAIARVLTETHSIALLGASANTERPSHQVLRFLLEAGYEVFPINPGLAGQTLLGRLVFARLSDIPVPIDMIDVFRQPKYLREIVSEAIGIGAKTLWTQLGVVDSQVDPVAERAGLDVVLDRCPAIEYPRLQAAGLIDRRPTARRLYPCKVQCN
jgi:predicted CoA-binding protein